MAPTNTEEHFRAIRDRLAALLPGTGPLGDTLRSVPDGVRDPAGPARRGLLGRRSKRAARGRRRTFRFPRASSFRVEKVTGKSWSGYNWYQGGFQSLIQVNTDLPIFIDRAVDLACHEGYPGHHVYNVLLEKNLVRDRGWVEFSVYPLFSPQSLIAEGSANFGIEVAFPGRGAHRRSSATCCFRSPGLDPVARRPVRRDPEAGRGLVVRRQRGGAAIPERRRSTRKPGRRLARGVRAGVARPRAEQRVRFFDQYRSYVINYNLGKDLVRRWIESQGGTADQPEKRWAAFARLLSSPRLPSDIQ